MLRPGFGKVRAALHVLHRDTGLTHATAIHQPLHAPCSVVPPEPPQIRGSSQPDSLSAMKPQSRNPLHWKESLLFMSMKTGKLDEAVPKAP